LDETVTFIAIHLEPDDSTRADAKIRHRGFERRDEPIATFRVAEKLQAE
jgi:hypothetical protein